MVKFCKKCGRILANPSNELDVICDCCGAMTYNVPEEYLCGDFKNVLPDKNEPLLIEEQVKTSSEFDPYWFDQREEILSKKREEYYAQVDRIKAITAKKGTGVKCPSCGSTSVSKIGVVNRIISTSLLGLASSKIGKTHKCNQCGATW